MASLACPVCGEGLAVGAPFCPECGQVPAYRASSNHLALAPAGAPRLPAPAGTPANRLPHAVVALVLSVLVGFGIVAAARQFHSAPRMAPAAVPATAAEADRIREEMRAAEAELRAKLRTLEERVQEAESKKRER